MPEFPPRNRSGKVTLSPPRGNFYVPMHKSMATRLSNSSLMWRQPRRAGEPVSPKWCSTSRNTPRCASSSARRPTGCTVILKTTWSSMTWIWADLKLGIYELGEHQAYEKDLIDSSLTCFNHSFIFFCDIYGILIITLWFFLYLRFRFEEENVSKSSVYDKNWVAIRDTN